MGNLNFSQIIFIMLTLCVAFMLILIFHSQLKVILRIIVQVVLGGIGIVLINTLLSVLMITPDAAVGLNVLTLSITGLLGIPGLCMLYFIGFLI